MSNPRLRHVRVSDSSNEQISLGGYKRPPHLSLQGDHLFWPEYTLRHSLMLKTPLPQASLQSKLPKRDLSLTFEWPTRSSTQALHRWSLWQLQRADSLGGYKMPPRLSLQGGHLFWPKYTLRHSLLSSKLLSLKLHFNPSFQWYIWASHLSDPLAL
jgi:hypothetical protein